LEVGVQFGVTLPHDEQPRDLVGLAREAEQAGWDGVFVWDVIIGNDVWVLLTAMMMATERLRLGTMLTPVSRRRPWKLAQETATLDQLSGGRVILPVGLGAPDSGFANFGEEIDRKTRAELLDEGLEIITGLWSGQPFSYEGKHYRVSETTFTPTPAQSPRIPIWVVGALGREKSMRRVARYDGLLPHKMGWPDAQVTPADIREARDYITAQRMATTPFDIVMEASTPGDDPRRAAEIVEEWQSAGCTWWLEAVWDGPRQRGGLEGMRKRIRQGPPRAR
jgi:alkanesulfonate monooxygenase SsuD/methylene tetrahydromethanopterin reductase-like flavin-dependent oxidoreductase (luciferase family)